MAKNARKNQRSGRGGVSKDMARIVVAVKKENGHYSFRQRMVPADTVKDELKKAQNGQ